MPKLSSTSLLTDEQVEGILDRRIRRILTTSQVAQLLSCSYSQARKLIISGEIAAVPGGVGKTGMDRVHSDEVMKRLYKDESPQPTQ